MNYMSVADKARLQEQLQELTKKRKVLSDRIGRARELGDLRENAEYHTAKDDQGHNERKIRDLEARLTSAVVVDNEDVPADMVFIGSTVRLRDLGSGDEDLYRLVGELSDDTSADYIEVTPNSPMVQSLQKARTRDTVAVHLPRGRNQFEIMALS